MTVPRPRRRRRGRSFETSVDLRVTPRSDYLRQNVHRLTPHSRATDHERNLLAITHTGESATNFGGIDLIAEVKGFFDGQQVGRRAQLNDDFFAVISLLAAGENPSDAVVQGSRSYILENRNTDGGWSYLISLESDVDDTAAAAGDGKWTTESGSTPVDGLLSLQMPNGAFQCFLPTNSAETLTTSYAIAALLGKPYPGALIQAQ